MGMSGQLRALTALTLGKRLSTHRTGGWVAPMAGLDGCGKSRLRQDSIPRPSIP